MTKSEKRRRTEHRSGWADSGQQDQSTPIRPFMLSGIRSNANECGLSVMRKTEEDENVHCLTAMASFNFSTVIVSIHHHVTVQTTTAPPPTAQIGPDPSPTTQIGPICHPQHRSDQSVTYDCESIKLSHSPSPNNPCC
ncbi:hypothetical protein DEO72_LG9g46 [Vigna unguiculata]|uniref:Uncharacterized protein n=1 Tax=Vigna unguiculata TaxID=3917 RepID=A0A4D6MU86_VIGUN|nr:hypothetical protein DEO72_LG9g46 [Vigna unguiculata]